MALEERNALLAHPYRFDETVARFVHLSLYGSSPAFTGSSTLSAHSVYEPSYTRTREYPRRLCSAKDTWLDSSPPSDFRDAPPALLLARACVRRLVHGMGGKGRA